MVDETEAEEFERRRQAAWKSAFQGGGGSGGEYPVKKKKPLTLAERQQQIKGISKAFVTPGAGWAKVDPVHVVEDDDDDKEDDNSDRGKNDHPDKNVVDEIRRSTGSHGTQLTCDSMSAPSKEKAETITAATNKSSPSTDSQKQMEIQLLDRLLEIARTQGSQVALSWAETQVQGSRVSNSLDQEKNTPPPILLSSSFLPLPVRLLPFNTPQAIDQERTHYPYFREAAQNTPYEYTSSSSVIFVIRRPYGYESRPGLFERISEQPNDLYKRKAHISTLETLEVAVLLRPNLPVLLLYGDGKVMFRQSPTQTKFQGGDIKMRLGTIAYPDGGEAAQQPRLYSLDTLAQQAMSLRQHYAVTMTTTAMVLVKTKYITESNTNKSTASVDVGVDTSDLVTITRKTVATNTLPSNNQNAHVQHFSWWIRKKLPTILLRRTGTWSNLLYLILLAGVLYVFSVSQFLIQDPSTRSTSHTKN